MNKTKLILLLFSICTGVLLVVQFGMDNSQKLYVSSQVISDYEVLIASEKKSILEIQTRTSEAEKKLIEYKELALSNDTDKIKSEIEDNIEYYKLISNSTEVKGQGLSILIDDGTRKLFEGEDANNVLVHDTDLLSVLNDLYVAGAEAVSLNGHRIDSLSSISCSGYTVRINDIFEARPFVIEAIGDPNTMLSALVGPGCFGSLLQAFGLVFEATIEDEIIMPGYIEDRNYRYMEVVKEEEVN